MWEVPGPDEDWYTLVEVAAYIGASDSTVKRLIRDGYLPPGVKLYAGGERYWRGDDLACYMHLRSRGACRRRPRNRKGTEKKPARGEGEKKS